MDRKILAAGLEPQRLTPLDRLAYAGAMGALSYEVLDDGAELQSTGVFNKPDLDYICAKSQAILKGNSNELLEELFVLNGSSGGARPKILVGVSKNKKDIYYGVEDLPNTYEHWIIKFPAHVDSSEMGLIEYGYHLMAKQAGIEMMPCHLFETAQGHKFFGTKRFDRDGAHKYHVHSASGLLHADHDYPSLDYTTLLKACFALTRDMNEVKKLYRLAVFNVLAHNRDDHAKNFSFIMDAKGAWRLAPAYDLTYSSGPGGEHSTMVCSNGADPGLEELLKLAAIFDIEDARDIYDEVLEAVQGWNRLAKGLGIKAKLKL